MLEYFRGHKRSDMLFQDEEVLDALASAAEERVDDCWQQEQALRHCIEGLRDRLWNALRLRYHEELSASQIAEKLGLTAVNTRSLLRRGRDALRNCMERFMQREPT